MMLRVRCQQYRRVEARRYGRNGMWQGVVITVLHEMCPTRCAGAYRVWSRRGIRSASRRPAQYVLEPAELGDLMAVLTGIVSLRGFAPLASCVPLHFSPLSFSIEPG